MGDLIVFPTPPGPTANDTDVILWRGCWACGLILFDDELPAGLCTECDLDLNRTPPAPEGKQRPLAFYLRHIRPETLHSMTVAIIETGTTQAETAAAEWAIDHHLDDRARAAYVGDVRGRATLELSVRCHDDAQVLGAQLGWWKGEDW